MQSNPDLLPVSAMSISAQPESGPVFGPEDSDERKQIREEIAGWDLINFNLPWKDLPIPLCECCLKRYHYPEVCSYREIVPEGEKVGPGFRLFCKRCLEEFHPDELQACVNCGNTDKMAVENECDICGEYRGHLEDACEYRDFVDWDALDKLPYAITPYLDADALEEAQRLKALQDGAKGDTQGKAT